MSGETTSSSSTSSNENVGIAIGLTFAAGACTAVGAAVVFVPSLVKLASKRVLASGLGFSAGVLIYLALVDMFPEATESFLQAGYDDGVAYALATGCFFGGLILMVLLNLLVTCLLHGKGGHQHHHHHHHDHDHHHHDVPVQQSKSNDNHSAAVTSADACLERPCESSHSTNLGTSACPCCSSDPVCDLERIQRMAQEIDNFQQKEHRNWDLTTAQDGCQEEACCDQGTCSRAGTEMDDKELAEAAIGDEIENGCESEQIATDISVPVMEGGVLDEQTSEHAASHSHHDHAHNQHHAHPPRDKALLKMGINTALAIALHNFPEGLATFVATLSDPKVGGVLAVAIAIHNVPMGLCVALPVYYATGNKLKAFTWACLSAVSEPLAALLGWAVLANSFTPTMFGSLFGIVSGMLVIVAARELLPTAHRYDPNDKVATFSFMVGMFIMALSLNLFNL
ncbi:hypothetical protein MPSEU_000905800 [Mayamaea pseudoterrestris]|nr:hypothetical protein MPSEU_000905800 [Mayamaea pseudoterrestris]